jgi:hypothetical protein
MFAWNIAFPLVMLAPSAETSVKDGPTAAEIRAGVERSLPFLTKDALAWKAKHKCATCHHAPMMAFALGEARNRGFAVDEKALGEVVDWVIEPKNWPRVFEDLPVDRTHSEPDYQGPLYMALGLAASKKLEATAQRGYERLVTRALTRQDKDGSWSPYDGRPPVFADREVMTLWLVLAIWPRDATDDPWKVNRERAMEWLAGAKQGDSTQALALRLIVQARRGRPPDELKLAVETLLARQNQDGGWGQEKDQPSDAFATGQALFALSSINAHPAKEQAISHAQRFLLKSQRPDGSWPMASRPGANVKPARYLVPITYAGSAWGTIGLVVSAPR